MQKIFVEKPYQFVRPVMNDRLPRLLNNRLIHVPLLRFGEKIVSVECRGVEKLRKSLDKRHAMMLVPNHPQTSDPVIIYALLRQARSPMFAMASWHLFHQSWFRSSVIRLYGGFSINREGRDKTAINFSISSLQNNQRPLLIFPEGATTRTNESMMPFLDGPSFIARSAARRRHKLGQATMIFPIAIRYRFVDEFDHVFSKLMAKVDESLKGKIEEQISPHERIRESLRLFVSRTEDEFELDSNPHGDIANICHQVSEALIAEAEMRTFGEVSQDNMTNRIRNLRAKIFPELLSKKQFSESEKKRDWSDLKRTYRAWQLSTYPKSYLSGAATPQQQIELASKLFEDVIDANPKCGRRRAIISVCDPVEVPADRFRGDGPDPLVEEIGSRLNAEIDLLANE